MEHLQFQNWAQDRKGAVWISSYSSIEVNRSNICFEDDGYGSGEIVANGESDNAGDQAAAVHELPKHHQALRLLQIVEIALSNTGIC